MLMLMVIILTFITFATGFAFGAFWLFRKLHCREKDGQIFVTCVSSLDYHQMLKLTKDELNFENLRN